MTTILGQQLRDGFIIAADSQVTSGDRPYRHSSMEKISRVGYLWVAGGGHAAACDLIQNMWTPPSRKSSVKMDPYHEMVTSIAPSIKWAIDKSGLSIKEDEEPVFLIGLDGFLFFVEGQAVMMSDTGIYGVGTGSHYAIGAVAAGASPEEAVKIASKFDVNTGGKIQVVKGVKNA